MLVSKPVAWAASEKASSDGSFGIVITWVARPELAGSANPPRLASMYEKQPGDPSTVSSIGVLRADSPNQKMPNGKAAGRFAAVSAHGEPRRGWVARQRQRHRAGAAVAERRRRREAGVDREQAQRAVDFAGDRQQRAAGRVVGPPG